MEAAPLLPGLGAPQPAYRHEPARTRLRVVATAAAISVASLATLVLRRSSLHQLLRRDGDTAALAASSSEAGRIVAADAGVAASLVAAAVPEISTYDFSISPCELCGQLDMSISNIADDLSMSVALRYTPTNGATPALWSAEVAVEDGAVAVPFCRTRANTEYDVDVYYSLTGTIDDNSNVAAAKLLQSGLRYTSGSTGYSAFDDAPYASSGEGAFSFQLLATFTVEIEGSDVFTGIVLLDWEVRKSSRNHKPNKLTTNPQGQGRSGHDAGKIGDHQKVWRRDEIPPHRERHVTLCHPRSCKNLSTSLGRIGLRRVGRAFSLVRPRVNGHADWAQSDRLCRPPIDRWRRQ